MVQKKLLWFLRELMSFDGCRRVSKTKVIRDVPPPPEFVFHTANLFIYM